MDECEFCEELNLGRHSRFHRVYKGSASSRVVGATERFVAIPTVGQLFTGSLLVLPVRHAETSAQLAEDERDELTSFVKELAQRTRVFGHPIWFEHGATAPSGGGCGIHHAHVHIVPLPKPTDPHTLFPEHQEATETLGAAWTALEDADHYLLIGNEKTTLRRRLAPQDRAFPSQFFRRRLAERFEIDRPWDWRTYKDVEPGVLATIASLTASHA